MESEIQPPAEPESADDLTGGPAADQAEDAEPTVDQSQAADTGTVAVVSSRAAAKGGEPVEGYVGPDVAKFAERVIKARARHADFDDVAFNPDLPVSAAMAEAIARAESGPDIAYHLGRNPALAARIAALDPLSAARELGRLEAQFDLPRRSVTAAPPPLRALGGGENPRQLPGDMSYDEYRRWRSGR